MRQVKLVDGRKVWEMSLPTSYDELSATQFEAVVGASDDLAGQQALWRSMGVTTSLLEQLPVRVMIELQHELQFLSDPNPIIDHFIIEKVEGAKPFEKLLAPKKRLEGMSLQQFMSIDSFFSYYITTKNEEFLAMMMASMYLRLGEGFIKDTEHPQVVHLEERARFFGKKPKVLLNCTLLNWVMIKNWLSKTYKNMFPAGSGEEGGKAKGADWLALFDTFVGDNIPFMESYQRMECMDAFRILDRKIGEQNKIK